MISMAKRKLEVVELNKEKKKIVIPKEKKK